MASGDVDQYFTYEARLTSFQKIPKKRASSASRAGKALNWPHKHLSPASLARAGFFFRPTAESVDNTVCFLCQKGLDGWEAGDDPLLEHLKHSPQCGWAVCAAIEVEIFDYAKEDPSRKDMVDARTATFGGRWPHDSKKGWKCKTKQLVEAGWKYTPTEDSDDMATCTYCQLALDGWEPNDKPFDEHFNRSPACPFFSLLEQYGVSNNGRARKPRSSSQSVASDMTFVTDQATGSEESTLQLAAKKKTKKAPVARTTRKKAKAEESMDITDDGQQADNESSQPPQPKVRRGRKRRSEAVESTVASTTDGPAPKKRTGQSPISANENLGAEDEDDEMTDASASKASDAGRPLTWDQQAEQRSSALPRPTPRSCPDDNEIERQLKEDLAQQLSEADIARECDLEGPAQLRMGRTPPQKGPVLPQAATDPQRSPKLSPSGSLNDELKMLQAEMELDAQKPSQAQRRSLPRTSGSTEKGEPETDETPRPASAPEDRGDEADGDGEDDGMTVGSTDTVLKKVYRGPTSKSSHKRRSDASAVSTVSEAEVEAPAKRGRGRPSKASLVSRASASTNGDTSSTDAPPKRGRGRPSKTSLASQDRDATLVADTSKEGEAPVKRGRGRPPKHCHESIAKKHEAQTESRDAQTALDTIAQPAEPSKPQDASSPVQSAAPADLPATPDNNITPAPSARQPVLSPSHSPQSSDAENQPPLRPPSASDTARRAAFAEVAATPLHLSPSKRNVLAGLKSTTPWIAANIDAIFGTPHPGRNRENSVDQFLRKGRELTATERNMTVEEWIYFNANEAEKKLKHECETLVSRFENEGTRAISVLEGLEVIE